MSSQWQIERIFLTVKAYPSISKKHHEASCMAGITASGKWIRIYPVFFRDLDDEQKFKKYSWIEAKVKRSNDFREESHYIDTDSIKILEHVSTQNNWSSRNAVVFPKLVPASKVFDANRALNKDTLAFIQPNEIVGLEIDETPDEAFKKQVQNMNELQQQLTLLPPKNVAPLDLVPYSFRYEFIDDLGRKHKMKIVDWEIYQLYRKCRYQVNWEDLIRQKYEVELPRKNIYFFVGTMHRWPQNWIIIGVYWPSSTASQLNMFDGQL